MLLLLLVVEISLLVLVVDAQPNPTITSTITVKDNAAAATGRGGTGYTSSWLKKVDKVAVDPRGTGCRNRPWICNQKEPSSEAGYGEWNWRRMCCRNRCVEVSSDVNNCGGCSVRCPFRWQCCNGLCVDTSMDPFHCGNCRKGCELGVLCFYGICGYAFPFPPPTVH